MIRLNPFNATVENTHATALKKNTLDKLKQEFANLPKSMPAPYKAPAIHAYLRDNIETILTGKPSQIRKHIRYFKSQFPLFHEYARANPTSKSSKYDPDLTAIVHAVRKAFDYDSFSEKRSGWGAYELVKAYNLRLCPYCNLNHVNFHYDVGRNKKTTKSLKMRPPLDHYYPRSRYPYLGISLYNLIPSCHQCNSSVKLQDDPLEHFLPHPYHFPLDAIHFTVDNILDYVNAVSIDRIKVLIQCSGAAEGRHANFFALSDRYGWYVHEIKDMHDRYLDYANVDSVLEPLMRPRILGFEHNDRDKRTLGFCLYDILEDLIRLPK